MIFLLNPINAVMILGSYGHNRLIARFSSISAMHKNDLSYFLFTFAKIPMFVK